MFLYVLNCKVEVFNEIIFFFTTFRSVQLSKSCSWKRKSQDFSDLSFTQDLYCKSLWLFLFFVINVLKRLNRLFYFLSIYLVLSSFFFICSPIFIHPFPDMLKITGWQLNCENNHLDSSNTPPTTKLPLRINKTQSPPSSQRDFIFALLICRSS